MLIPRSVEGNIAYFYSKQFSDFLYLLYSRLRLACNACSRIKKRCDGGHPCGLCVKSNFQCVYEQRVRPGPTPKRSSYTIKTKDKNFESATIANNNSNNLDYLIINNDDMQYIDLFLLNLNGNLPFITKEMINLCQLGKYIDECHDHIDYFVSIGLCWLAASYGSLLLGNLQLSEYYLLQSHYMLSKSFDNQTILTVKFYYSYEILLNVIKDTQMITHLTLKSNMYYNFGEFLHSKIDLLDIDAENLRFYLNIHKKSVLKSQNMIEFVTNSNVTNEIEFSYIMLHYWNNQLGLSHNSNEIINDNNYQLNIYEILKYIQKLEILLIPSINSNLMNNSNCNPNPTTLMILHFSLAINYLKNQQINYAFAGFRAIALYLLIYPSILSSFDLWKFGYIVKFSLMNIIELSSNEATKSPIQVLIYQLEILLNQYNSIFNITKYNEVLIIISTNIHNLFHIKPLNSTSTVTTDTTVTTTESVINTENSRNGFVSLVSIGGLLRLMKLDSSFHKTPSTKNMEDDCTYIPSYEQQNQITRQEYYHNNNNQKERVSFATTSQESSSCDDDYIDNNLINDHQMKHPRIDRQFQDPIKQPNVSVSSNDTSSISQQDKIPLQIATDDLLIQFGDDFNASFTNMSISRPNTLDDIKLTKLKDHGNQFSPGRTRSDSNYNSHNGIGINSFHEKMMSLSPNLSFTFNSSFISNKSNGNGNDEWIDELSNFDILTNVATLSPKVSIEIEPNNNVTTNGK